MGKWWSEGQCDEEKGGAAWAAAIFIKSKRRMGFAVDRTRELRDAEWRTVLAGLSIHERINSKVTFSPTSLQFDVLLKE